MTGVEQMQCQMAHVSRRLQKLEEMIKLLHGRNADGSVAIALGTELGLAIETITDPIKIGRTPRAGALVASERRTLGRTLRVRGWSAERIARVMHCSEKTVRRWLAYDDSANH